MSARCFCDVAWTIYVPYVADIRPEIIVTPGNEEINSAGEAVDVSDDGHHKFFVRMDGRCVARIYPGQRVNCATISISIPHEKFEDHRLRSCEYVFECEDGRFPSTGMATLDLRMLLHFDMEAKSD
jgi:hypothetical protein